jgi:hypothetical protein
MVFNFYVNLFPDRAVILYETAIEFQIVVHSMKASMKGVEG